MKKLTVFSLLFFFFLSFTSPALATRVAVVLSGKDPIYQKLAEAYLQNLHKNHPDLQSLIFYLSEQDPEDVRKQLLNFYPNVNFAVGGKAAELCKKLILFPFIYTMVLNPEKADLMDPHGKNKANCTGIKVLIDPKSQLEQLKKVLPKTKVIGRLYSAQSAEILGKAQEVAQQMGLTLETAEVQSLDEVSQKFRELVKKGIDAFWLQVDPNVLSQSTLEYLVQGCQMREINLLTFNPNHVKDGASIAVYIDYTGLGEQAAKITTRILNGTSIDSIPSAEAEAPKTSINAKFLFKGASKNHR
jgi:ABC-type uncharacterized transport system substrate-binding protein